MKQRDPRRKVLIDARLRQDCGWSDARILDISRRGLLIRATKAPSRGTYVEICRGGHRILARVVWVSQGKFGVRTQDAVAVEAIITAQEVSPPRPANDRRALQRRPTIKERREASRRWSRRIEFAAVSLFVGAAAIVAFDTVHDSLREPLNRVEATLSANR